MHGSVAFQNSTWGACREVVWRVSVWELTFTSVSICSWKKQKHHHSYTHFQWATYIELLELQNALYCAKEKCKRRCLLHWHPSFYTAGITTLENVSLIRDLTSTQAISLLSCHLFNQLTPFIQNPVAKHYISFNSLKTKSVLSRKTMWKATELVWKFNCFSTAFTILPGKFSCCFNGLNQLSKWIDECQRLIFRYNSRTTGLKQDNGTFSF